ncbi:MAG: hypothetical protein ACQEQV_03325 [Fibrobacterota bacterium]
MKGVLIGGILPAVLIGTALTLLKLFIRLGVSPAQGMLCISAGVALTGATALVLTPQGNTFASLPASGIAAAVGAGLFWSAGTYFMSFAVAKYDLPMSVSASLAAANALIAVLLSLLLFQEGANLSLLKLMTGALLIVSGSILITQA